MLGRVQLEQSLDEERQPGQVGLVDRIRATEHAHLPEDEHGSRVDDRLPREEVGRLVALAAARPRVDAEVGEQAVLGRDAGQHPGLEPFRPRLPHGRVARGAEDARMPVERDAHREAATHRRHDLLDHGFVDPPPLGARLVQVVECSRPRIEPPDDAGRHRLGDQEEHLVGMLDRVACLVRQLDAGADPRPDDDERARRHEPKLERDL